MTRFVIDAPTLLFLVRERAVVPPAHQLVAPNAIRSQAMTLLLHEVRRGELTEREALQRHDRLTEMKMRLLGDRVSRRTAWQIAQDQQWDSLEDAEYVAVARLQADALVTIDVGFARKVRGLVPVEPVTVLVAADR